MSAIDSYNHAHVGNFSNIPIYWLLENVEMSELTDNTEDDEYFLNQYNLSIGGGSGEHPALILKNDSLILNFLRNISDDKDSSFNEVDYQLYELVDNITDRYIKEHQYYYSLNTNQWSLETFIKINDEIKKVSKEKNQSIQDNRSLENKIMDDIALFIIYKMPLDYCLEDPQLIEAAKIIRSNTWEKIFKTDIFNYSILSNLHEGSSFGKIIKNNQVIWGYSLKDWIQDNKAIELANKLNESLSPKHTKPKVKI
jgi:hypothetical protein